MFSGRIFMESGNAVENRQLVFELKQYLWKNMNNEYGA